MANPSAEKLNRTTQVPIVDEKTLPFDFHSIPSVKPRTHLKSFWINSSFDPFQIDRNHLSEDQLIVFDKLKWQFENQLLTELGFKKEVNKLMEVSKSVINLHQPDINDARFVVKFTNNLISNESISDLIIQRYFSINVS